MITQTTRCNKVMLNQTDNSVYLAKESKLIIQTFTKGLSLLEKEKYICKYIYIYMYIYTHIYVHMHIFLKLCVISTFYKLKKVFLLENIRYFISGILWQVLEKYLI